MAAASKPMSPPQPTTAKRKPKKSAKTKIKKKPRKLRLKGWLKTPEDWAKFNAWAAVNALPRKQTEPELIIRPSKPLPRLRKRIAVLSKPSPSHGEAQACFTRSVSKAALKAKPSRRTKQLARPNWKDDPDDCHEWTISRAALLYEPSDNIQKLSQPVLRDKPEDCRLSYPVFRKALKRKTTEKDEKPASPKKVRGDMQGGEKKKKEAKELSPWMEFLALPAYRVLKDQEFEKAKSWKSRILDETEVRGKQALKEQKKREEEKEREKKIQEKKAKEELKAQRSKSNIVGEEENEVEVEEAEGMEKESEEEPTGEEEKSQEVEEDAKSKQQVQFGEDEVQEDEETKMKRRMNKEPWRFTDSTCKELPLKIPESALTYEASINIIELSKPKNRKAEDCIEDPFKVKESAKSARASPTIQELAKPKYPVEPRERPPPREKDRFGRPIFPPPVYGKVLPKVKPYQMSECKDENEDDEASEDEEGGEKVEEQNKKKQEKKKIDPIAYAPTIDPIFDPSGAAKQARERKRAAEQAAENKENKADESVEDQDEEVADAPDADENVEDETGNEDENEDEVD